MYQDDDEVLLRPADEGRLLAKECCVSGYAIDRQLQSNWCWAAVTTSLARFYGMNGFTNQAQLASQLPGIECRCNGSGCSNCNRPWYIGKALAQTGMLQKAIPAATSRIALIRQLRKKRPVVIAIKWPQSATGHLLVVSALYSRNKFMTWDSRGPAVRFLSYEQLLHGYEGKSVWVNTFFTNNHKTHT